MLPRLRLTPKYGRMCALATVAGGTLSGTRGKTHRAPECQAGDARASSHLKEKEQPEEREGGPSASPGVLWGIRGRESC